MPGLFLWFCIEIESYGTDDSDSNKDRQGQLNTNWLFRESAMGFRPFVRDAAKTNHNTFDEYLCVMGRCFRNLRWKIESLAITGHHHDTQYLIFIPDPIGFSSVGINLPTSNYILICNILSHH
jgi:hypothetical protein